MQPVGGSRAPARRTVRNYADRTAIPLLTFGMVLEVITRYVRLSCCLEEVEMLLRVIPTGRLGTVLLMVVLVCGGCHVSHTLNGTTGSHGVITGNGVRLRIQPNRNAPTIGHLSKGARVVVREEQGSWYKIENPGTGQEQHPWLWISRKYVRIVDRNLPITSQPKISSRQPRQGRVIQSAASPDARCSIKKTSDGRMLSLGDWTVRETNSKGVAVSKDGRRLVLWEAPHCDTGCECSTFGQVISFVGNVVSYSYFHMFECEGAMHPSGEAYFKSQDVKQRRPVSVDALTSSQGFWPALRMTSWYQQCEADAWSSVCDRDPSNLDHHFGVKAIRNGRMIVQIGLLHGSQANAMTQGGGEVEVTVSPQFLAVLEESDRCGMLGVHLALDVLEEKY